MAIEVDLTLSNLDTAAKSHFSQFAELAYALLDHLREISEVPEVTVTVWLADDLATAIPRLSMPGSQYASGPFEARRLGGLVAAKNLPQSEDGSRVAIVFDSSHWADAEDPRLQAIQLSLMAHELAHTLQSRARHAGGSDDDVYPSFTGQEVARSISRIVKDEYGADVLADTVLAQFANVTHPDGSTGPVGTRELYDYGPGSLFELLRLAHPSWPDIVQRYREHRLDLSEMWGKIVEQTEQTLTTITHVQAAVDRDRPSQGVLEMAPLHELPAVTLYLGPLWRELWNAIRRQTFLGPPDDFARSDREIVAIGESALVAMWNRLGLYPEEKPNREWALWVREPIR